jgi:hypothetical protein
MNQTFLYSRHYSSARRAEEILPSLPYRELVANLGELTALGVISYENPATMLVVARLVDRGRIMRSGMSAVELRSALEDYRAGGAWRPVASVVKALEQAISTIEC